MNFVALDFETATGSRASACALGIVTVSGGEITEAWHTLIRPPDNQYWRMNIGVHGITPAKTRSSPDFAAIYPEIRKRLHGKTVVAHNESFDRSVLKGCMEFYSLDYSELMLPAKWECTVKIYRALGFSPCRLCDCCERLNIQLNHHEALSDAMACAQLYLRRKIARP